MRKRAMLLGLLGLGLFALTGRANALDPDQERADRARAMRQQLAELEAIGRARVLKERGVTLPTRPAVTTASPASTSTPAPTSS